jgi:tetratricopeptide (TPR) repeat protein
MTHSVRVPPVSTLRPERLLAGSVVLWCAFSGCAGTSPDPGVLAQRRFVAGDLSAEQRAAQSERVVGAEAFLVTGQTASARALVEDALRQDPADARARALLGNVLLAEARSEDPPDLFRMREGDGETLWALQHQPDDPVVVRLRGRFLAESGHITAAAEVGEAYLDRVAELPDEDHAEVTLAVAAWCYEIGEEQRALPRLRVAVRRRPGDALAWYRLGDCLLRTADSWRMLREAADAFVRSAQADPADEAARLASVTAASRALNQARREGASEEAPQLADFLIQLAEQAVQAFPSSAAAWHARGVVARQLGREVAHEDWQQALTIDPGHLASLLDLAALRHEQGVYAEATALWQRALAADALRGGLRPGERARLQELVRDAGQVSRQPASQPALRRP